MLRVEVEAIIIPEGESEAVRARNGGWVPAPGRSVSCKGNVSAMITNCLATHGHEHANYNKSRADWKPIAAGIMNWNPIAAGKLADWNPVASISHVEYQTAIYKYLHVPVI
jgi:hypothetical protein